MNKHDARKLAEVLKVLITITFVCNLITLLLVPGLSAIRAEGGWAAAWGSPDPLAFLAVCWQYLFRLWRFPYLIILAVYLWVCGACTAIILWQARRVLDTIIAGEPFRSVNAKNLNRAAVCFFIISAASLVRFALRVGMHEVGGYNGSPYAALFVPVFAMGGLLCLVMSALFRQAAELKEENDLTI